MSEININPNLHEQFSQKVRGFVEHNMQIIRDYFQSNGTISKPNESPFLSEDMPILYIRNPTNENNFYLEIYNIAAVFRFENGFFHLIHHLNTIFSIFNNRYEDQPIDTKKRQLVSLFKGIEEQDSEKINEIIGFYFEEDLLYDIKLGLDKLVKYFGLQNIQKYFESKVNYKKIVAKSSLPGIVTGVAVGILSGSLIIGTGIGLGVGIIIGIVSLISIKWNKPAPQRIDHQGGIDNNEVEKNIKKIEYLFTKIKFFYTNNYYKIANVIIVAVDKSNENYNDFIIYGDNLKYLDLLYNPKKETPGTNREYYDICFELIHKYINNYETMFQNHNANLEKQIKDDFEVLKGKKTLAELKYLLNQLILKEKEPLKNQKDSISNALKEKEAKGKISESTISFFTSNSTEAKEIKKNIKKKQLLKLNK